RALDVARLDVMNAADVEEVVLVVVRQQPFHLLGRHAAVGLGDVNDRQVERRKDVHLHAPVGQRARGDEGDHADEDRDRVAERKADGIHDGVAAGHGDVEYVRTGYAKW